MSEEIVELHAIVRGRVQGVGFRYVTEEAAKRLGLVGTVKNKADGSVEIYAQGSRGQVESLLEYLTGPRGPGQITHVDKELSPPVHHFDAFRIER